ncbi:hypothetical protein CRV15_30955 (plasmid) [Streptomyces clavuligerus]|uniref:Uncharacterized protein n=1 Tax=Streptomyces clavuligerus TaxID=1901 RepID=B5GTK7_STRCL|nr:hypothetical protein SSCG_02755 [Streptomyces clavuligerus]EFG04075.1 Hypothetical protein SCLAV_p0588 [Streptomyces clavuligerus]QCS10003.1 hypothetical protein CRV15_30955 [Streptomyces clavuligerus]QPJ97953.1 hypothetical protein GE265_33490 [Streptomyces clavuligerus]
MPHHLAPGAYGPLVGSVTIAAGRHGSVRTRPTVLSAPGRGWTAVRGPDLATLIGVLNRRRC